MQLELTTLCLLVGLAFASVILLAMISKMIEERRAAGLPFLLGFTVVILIFALLVAF